MIQGVEGEATTWVLESYFGIKNHPGTKSLLSPRMA